MKTNLCRTPANQLLLSTPEASVLITCIHQLWRPMRYFFLSLNVWVLHNRYCVCPPLQKTENPTLNWAWHVVLLASSDVAILFIEKWLRQWRRECACTFSADCGRIAAVTAADIFGRQICRRHVRGHVADVTAACPRTWRRHCLPINASTYFNVTCHTTDALPPTLRAEWRRVWHWR